MKNDDIVPNGRRYEMIKIMKSLALIKPELIPKIGDIFSERDDQWYESNRTELLLNLEVLPNRSRYFKKLTKTNRYYDNRNSN